MLWIVGSQLKVIFVTSDAGFSFTMDTVAINAIADLVDLLKIKTKMYFFFN